jgi:adenylate kinase
VKHRVEAVMFKPEIDFLVLDGIPRNVEQARHMESHIEVLKVFHLSCPDRTELARRLRKRALKDNRFDDANETVIQNRFATYEAETKPILDYYAGTASWTSTPARLPPRCSTTSSAAS